MLGHVVVDDMADAGDIDAAGGDVGGDHHLVAPRLESFERIDTFLLGAVGMHHGHLVLFVLKLARDAVGTVLGPAEDDDAVIFGAVEHRLEQVELLGHSHGIERVLHRLGGRTTGTDGDLSGVAQAPGGEALDLLGNGCREEEGLPLLGALLHDAADIGKESHVEHPVDLVEDKNLEVGEADLALLHEIEQAPRRGYDDVGSLGKGLALGAITDSAEDDDGVQVGECGKFLESLLHLERQFTGRLQDEAAGLAIGSLEAAEDRKAEGGGLSRACLGGGDEIPPIHGNGNRLRLNRRRLHITHPLRAVDNGFL